MTYPDAINTCFQTTESLRVIARYSHIIPIILSLSLAIFVFIKARYNLFSRIFLLFVIAFCTWLLGDLIIWTTNNYFLVYSIWSFLIYVEIIFYVIGLYFVLVFLREKDISWLLKGFFFLLTLFPLFITVTKKSVLGFDQSVCNASNNSILDIYKVIVESGIGLTILVHIVQAIFKKQDPQDKKADLIVMSAVLVFFSVFGITEYISSLTGNYTYNLYSLFVLPVFLIAIIYTIFELDIFKFELLGTHYLVVGLMILTGGQLFFTSGDTDRFLTILTISLTIGISVILFRNLKRESDQRIHIEKLSVQLEKSRERIEQTNTRLESANDKLKGLDKLKTEFLGLASHQLRSPLTAIKGYASMLLEGDFGEVNPKAQEAVGRIYQSSRNLTVVVEDLLNVSKIEQGGMKYTMEDFNLAEIAESMVKDFSINAQKKGLELLFEASSDKDCMVNGDKEKLRQVILNFIDNSMKYTKKGSINVSVKKVESKVVFAVQDTGMGMTSEIKATLFQKFERGDGARMNTSGSGLGLYLAREIVEAHHGRVWVESDGPNKGSKFCMELASVAKITKKAEKPA